MDVSWPIKKAESRRIDAFNCGVGKDSWESLGLQGDPTSPSYRRSVLDVHWREWCWSWNSNTLATWWGELTHLKRPWCWERWKVEGEGDDREWDDWMALLTQWTWVCVDSGVGDGQGGLVCCVSWGHKESDMTEWLNWTELNVITEGQPITFALFYGLETRGVGGNPGAILKSVATIKKGANFSW